MKKIFISLIAGTMLLTGCGEDAQVSQQGGIAVDLSLDNSVINAVESRSSLDDLLGAITPDQLKFKLERQDGKYSYEYDSYKEIPTGFRYPIGTYTVSATYGDVDIEGINQPAIKGTASVVIRENRETPVSVTAKLANSILKVDYTDNFKEYAASYNSQLNSPSGQTFNIPAGDDSDLFFKPGSTSVTVNLVKPNGEPVSVSVTQFDAQPQHLYKITFDIDQRSGLALLNVTFNDQIIPEQKPIDLSADLSVIPAPYLVARGFTPDESSIDFIENLPYDQELDIQVIAMAGLKSVTLTTTSITLCSVGVDGVTFPKEVELLGADDEKKSQLSKFSFEAFGIWNNPDRMAVLDFSSVLQWISYLSDPTSNETTFTVVATDLFNRQSEPMTLKLSPIKLRLVLTSTTEFALGMYEDVAHVHVEYNGGLNFADQLRFEYQDPVTKVWTKTTATEIRQTPESMNPTKDKYRLCAMVKVPATTDNITIHAHCGQQVSNEVTFRRVGSYMHFEEDYDEAGLNTFATHAEVHLNSSSIDQTGIEIFARKKGAGEDGWFKVESTPVSKGDIAADITISGLEPDTEYELKARAKSTLAGKEDETIETDNEGYTIHTEPALQLPNGNMDTWYRVNGATNYWWIAYPGSSAEETVWGTMNQLTTSQGGSSTSAFDDNRNGCSYNAYSGTREDTNGRNGSCAVISTVGWGAGNRATGSVSSTTCRNLTVGELYLSGECNVSELKADYNNYSFTSRPSGMKFWYKYVPKNSADYGVAEIEVFDANGKRIAYGSFNPRSASSWTDYTIPLTYAADCAKAAYIQVRFKSSGNTACQSISSSNINSPGFGNTSDGRFTGSEMYIDDIELVY